MRNNKNSCHPKMKVVTLAAITVFTLSAAASGKERKLKEELTTVDNQFWRAYNACDIEKIATFLLDDVEFFHDKSGMTRSSTKLLASIKRHLCSDPNMHLRREEQSSKIYPIKNYGAIMGGTHVFYLSQQGNAERLDSKAQFMHLWQNNNGEWKLSRILSFDHQVTSENADIKPIETTLKALSECAGQYQMDQMGGVTVDVQSSGLRISTKGFEADVYLESKDLFFHKNRPLKFRFIRGESGSVIKMQVLENGQVVDSANKL